MDFIEKFKDTKLKTDDKFYCENCELVTDGTYVDNGHVFCNPECSVAYHKKKHNIDNSENCTECGEPNEICMCTPIKEELKEIDIKYYPKNNDIVLIKKLDILGQVIKYHSDKDIVELWILKSQEKEEEGAKIFYPTNICKLIWRRN